MVNKQCDFAKMRQIRDSALSIKDILCNNGNKDDIFILYLHFVKMTEELFGVSLNVKCDGDIGRNVLIKRLKTLENRIKLINISLCKVGYIHLDDLEILLVLIANIYSKDDSYKALEENQKVSMGLRR